MNLKELKDKIKELKKELDTCDTRTASGQGRHCIICSELDMIRLTVKAVDKHIRFYSYNASDGDRNDWYEIKKLLTTHKEGKKNG